MPGAKNQEPRLHKESWGNLGSWFLVLGSRHELHRLKPNSFDEILIIGSLVLGSRNGLCRLNPWLK